jgi:uncharacterized delta-60 repeat protein
MALIVVRYLPDGGLDQTFGGTGIVRTQLDGSERAVVAMAVNAQNQITVVTSGPGFQAARYREDGTLITSFGQNGTLSVPTPFPVSDAFIEIVQQQIGLGPAAAPGNPLDRGPLPLPTSRLAVVGTASMASGHRFAAGRYQPFAQADPTFNGGNHVTTNFDGRASNAGCVRVDEDGRIYAAGWVSRADGTASDMALARYRSDGTADFRAERQVGQNDTRARAITFGRQGSIVIAGDIHSQSADADFGFIARFLSTGAQDTGFSDDGLRLDVFGQGNVFQPGEPPTKNSYVTAVDVDGSNRAVVVGELHTGNRREFAVARFRADGVPDTAFNGTGRTTTGFVNALRSLPTAVTVGQVNGIITAVGGADGAFAVARFRDNGTLDQSFGGDGRVTTAVSADDEFAFAGEVAIDGHGRIVVAGVSTIPVG